MYSALVNSIIKTELFTASTITPTGSRKVKVQVNLAYEETHPSRVDTHPNDAYHVTRLNRSTSQNRRVFPTNPAAISMAESADRIYEQIS